MLEVSRPWREDHRSLMSITLRLQPTGLCKVKADWDLMQDYQTIPPLPPPRFWPWYTYKDVERRLKNWVIPMIRKTERSLQREASGFFLGKKDNWTLPDMSESMTLDEKFAQLKLTWFKHTFINTYSDHGSSCSTHHMQLLIGISPFHPISL